MAGNSDDEFEAYLAADEEQRGVYDTEAFSDNDYSSYNNTYDEDDQVQVEEVQSSSTSQTSDHGHGSSLGSSIGSSTDTVSLLINGKLFTLIGDGQKGKCTMCTGERSSCTTSNRGSAMTRHLVIFFIIFA